MTSLTEDKNNDLIELAKAIGGIGEIQESYYTPNIYDAAADQTYTKLINGMLILSYMILCGKEENETIHKIVTNIINFSNGFSGCHAIAHYPYNKEYAESEADYKIRIEMEYNRIRKFLNSISFEELDNYPPFEIENILSSCRLDIDTIRSTYRIFNLLASHSQSERLITSIKENFKIIMVCIQIALKFQSDFDLYSGITVTYAAALIYIKDCYLDIVNKLLQHISKKLKSKISLKEEQPSAYYTELFKTLDSLVNTINLELSSSPSSNEEDKDFDMTLLPQLLSIINKLSEMVLQTGRVIKPSDIDAETMQNAINLINDFLNKASISKTV